MNNDFKKYTHRMFDALAKDVSTETDFRKACNYIAKEIDIRKNNSRERFSTEALAYYSAANNLGKLSNGFANLCEQVRKDLLAYRGEDEVDLTPDDPKKKKQSFNSFSDMWHAHNNGQDDKIRNSVSRDDVADGMRVAISMQTDMMRVRNKIDSL